MATFVKEYDWMWLPSGLNLSPAECRVYAYIYGLTESKQSRASTRTQPCGRKGYNGSVRQLAKDLGLNHGHVSRILRKLQDDNRITLTGEVWASVALSTMSGALNTNDGALNTTSGASSTESGASSTSPLTTPLYKEINKEMERDNNIARNTIATQRLQTPFSIFKDSYIDAAMNWHGGVYNGREGAENWFKYRGAFAEELWQDYSEIKRRMILKELKCRDGFWRKNPEFLLKDYQLLEPKNYNGSLDLNRMAHDGDMVVALYNGKAGIYTRQDAEDYGMQILRPFKIQQ